MLRFQRNPGFKLLSPRRFQPRGRFANFQVCLFVKLAAGLFLQNSAFFNLFTAVASEMTAHWFSNFFQVIFYFVCLFVKLAYLSPISPNSNDMVPISRNLKKGTCFPSFSNYFCLFVCLLSCFPYFLKFPLFVCLLSFFSSFLPLSNVKRTIILVIFFSNFQGFTLLPWQKVGRIWLEITQIFKFLHFLAISLQNSFFLPSFLSIER